MASYLQGAVTVTSTATLICTVAAVNDGAIVQNGSGATVYLGGPDVTASGANQGVSLAASATMTVPSVGGLTHSLYGITASTSTTVAYLYPGT